MVGHISLALSTVSYTLKNRRSHQNILNVVHTQDRLGENWRVLCQPHWMTFWSQLLVKARKMGQDDFDHISLSSLNFCKAKFIHRGGGRAAADKGKVDWSLQTRYKCHCHYHTQPLTSLVWKEMKHKAKACPKWVELQINLNPSLSFKSPRSC